MGLSYGGTSSHVQKRPNSVVDYLKSSSKNDNKLLTINIII